MEEQFSTEPGTPGNESHSINGRIVSALLRRKRLIIWTSMISILGAVALYLTGRTYVSEAKLLARYVFTNPSPPVADFASVVDSKTQALRNRNLMRRVAELVGPVKILRPDFKNPSLDAATVEIQRHLTVTNLPRGSVIVIRFEHRNPETVREVVQKFVTMGLEQLRNEGQDSMENGGIVNLVVVQEASPGRTRIPKLPLKILLVLAGGFGGGIVLAFLLEMLPRS